MFKHVVHGEFYAPADVTNAGPLTASSIEDALAADDSDSESSDEPSDDKPDADLSFLSSDDESDEEEEEPEDDKKSDEDKPELKLDEENEDEIELSRIPKRQEIKAAYPDIFKKFPALDHIIQREHAFAEVFPTISDAKSAKESIGQFNQFQSELLSGNIENVLKAVRTTDAKAFNKIADGILDSLVRVDSNSHLGVTRQVTKGVLNYIHTAASSSLKKNPDDKRAQQLQIASELIHEALYDTNEVTPYQATQTREAENPEVEKLRSERASFEKARFDSAFNSLASKMSTRLTSAVTRDIDTKNLLPPYVKNTVVKDVMNELDRQLTNDSRFRGLVDKLWLKAKESNYNDSSMKQIETALTEKAKTILPGIMRLKRGEAMKGLSVKERKTERKLVSRDNNEERAPRKLTSTRQDSDKLPRPGERAIDFLMRD